MYLGIRRASVALAIFGALVSSGCESATASGRSASPNGNVRGNDVLDDLPIVASPFAAVSARRVAPGLYAVRAKVTTGDVTLAVRVTNGPGFATLTSGTEMLRFSMQGMAQDHIQTQTGYRYLVMAIPGEDDPALLDYDLAAYTEIVP